MNNSTTTRWALPLLALPVLFGAAWILSGCSGSETDTNAPTTDQAAPPADTTAPSVDDSTSSAAPSGDFAAAAGLWQEVMAASAELDKTIAAKDMEGVHHKAFALRDKAKLLTGKSGDLAADGLASLAKGLETVSSLASELDEAGDNNKQVEAEALNEKLHTVLNAIKALYPAGVLK